MLKLIREKITCDLKRIARLNNEILFAELFGRNQVVKALSASILEKRSEFILSDGRLNAVFVDKGARYKRKIAPLNDGYAHCIVYQDELFSEKYLIAKDTEDRKRAFQIWLSKIALPIPYKNNPAFTNVLYEEINCALDWKYMEVENKIEEGEEIPHWRSNLTKKESLSFCNMDFLIRQEYAELVEAVESVFADFKLNKKIASGDKMARLACEEKLAYYPTDPNAMIAFFEAMKANGEFGDFRVCDPCCGMGDILSLFKTHFKGVQTYGVELDVERAEIASDKVDILINNDALFGIQKTKSAFQFLFLNPPYGDIKLEKNERLETEFIKKWLGTLEINGLLLLIINPSSATPLMAKLLENGGMEFKASFYFENKDRELYKQYFMLFQKAKEPTNNLLEHIHPDNAIPFSETDLSEIFIPKSKKEKITFKAFGDLKDWQKEKMLSKSSLSKDFIHSLLTPAISIGVSSIQIPNEGQSALLLGAGACDREVNGYLIKVSFEKVEVQGEATENGQRVQENFVSNIYAFDTYKGSYFKLI